MKEPECPFCNPDDILYENRYAYAKYDKYPVNPGHILIIPKRHCYEWFGMKLVEKIACWMIVEKVKRMLDKTRRPDGYNVGFNCEKAAGQTVFHTHIHIIPRYNGDTENPRGGIRKVIPEKADY
jgi:diadenosine tetraphosphate (Ap4A) HIT family hydrolase